MNRQDFAIFSGEDKTLAVTVQDSAGTAVDITGAAISWALAAGPDSAALVTKDNTSSPQTITIVDALNGRFDVSLSDTDTEALAGLYYHEAELIDGGGDNQTVVYGWVTIKGNLL